MNKKLITLITASLFIFPCFLQAAGLGKIYAGRFIINKEKDHTLWYVNPANNYRYLASSTQDVFNFSKEKAKLVDVQNLFTASSSTTTEKFLIENRGLVVRDSEYKYWFIGNDKKIYSLVDQNFWNIIKEKAIPLAYKDFIRIYRPGLQSAVNEYSNWGRQEVKIDSGTFKLDVITIDLNNPKLKVVTDAAADGDCPKKCPAKPVANYALEHKAFAAINGSYFDTSSAKKNYYFFPVYDTAKKVMVNQAQLKYWTTGPIMAFDNNNNFYYFQDSRYFKKAVDFTKKDGPVVKSENKSGVLTSAIGNLPLLIKEGHDFLLDFAMDEKQKTHKALLSALCYKAEPVGKGKILLVSARNSSIADLTAILLKLKVDYALNLDGGGSAAVIYGDELMIGPGRDVPNAILFAEK